MLREALPKVIEHLLRSSANDIGRQAVQRVVIESKQAKVVELMTVSPDKKRENNRRNERKRERRHAGHLIDLVWEIVQLVVVER